MALYFFVALLRTIVQCLKMAQVGSKMAQNHETAWHGQIFGPIFGPLWRPILPHLASSCPILRSPNPTLLWGFAPWTNICPRWLQRGQNVSQDGPRWLQDDPKLVPRPPKTAQDGPKWSQDGPRRPKTPQNVIVLANFAAPSCPILPHVTHLRSFLLHTLHLRPPRPTQ